MPVRAKKTYLHTAMLAGVAVALSACSGEFSKTPSAGIPGLKSANKTAKSAVVKPPVSGEIRTKAKFKAGRSYGAASERIVKSAFAPVPRGGGRAVVGKPYKINGRWYKPRHQPNYNKTGIASWYGPNFHGRKTANGEVYDQTALSAAHPTLPLPSYVRVENVRNGRSVIVRVNDRGPFHKTRIIDLSYRTAELLGTRAGGIAKVKVKYIGRAPVDGSDEKYLLSSYKGPGSVEPSKVAARKKLLQYAGLSPEEVNAALNGEIGGETQIAAAPTRVIQPAVPKNPAPTPAPILVSNTPTAPTASIKPAALVGSGDAGPLVLRPRLLWQEGGSSTVTPNQGQPAQVIKARPNGQNAYLPTVDVRNVFDGLLKPSKVQPLAFQIRQTILIGKNVAHDDAFKFVEKFSRYGSVSLSSELNKKNSYASVTLETNLPFALKIIRKTAPNAIVISQN
ncbi:MAG: septal ring lytic transglycosylase RlpA family protein [Hyphomicrobiales bacterium]